MNNQSQNVPTQLVVFGATGDLMAKKIVPALFHLFEKQKLPQLFKVVGVARRAFSYQTFQDYAREIISQHAETKIDQKNLKNFTQLFSYQRGQFENKGDYQKLAKALGQVDGQWKVCANKLYYLAVPPHFYETIFKNLAQSGLTKPCSEEEGWTRVIVEKPFGKDLKTAKELDSLLSKLFKEVQIYIIDHYLAKDILQNILAFRFSNNLFEQTWNNQFIERIEIRLLETLGVEDRGSFYDGVGALRDVGQNHLLQMLALVTMEHPVNFQADAIRSKRAEVLQTLKIPTQAEAKSASFRAQYEGYQDIEGVSPGSQTETYFKVLAYLNSPRFKNIPIILEGGKRLVKQIKEIVVTFKHPAPCLCPPGVTEHYKNNIIISLEPEAGITIHFWSKKPGLEFEIEQRTFDVSMQKGKGKAQYVEEYEKLLLDCTSGDQTLFVSTAEVRSMWQFIDPIISAWQENLFPLKTYQPNTNQPLIESTFIEDAPLIRTQIKKEIGVVGLGKMGTGIAKNLIGKGWQVVGFNRTPETTRQLENSGVNGVYSLKELVDKLSSPRIIWLMVPAGKPIDEVIFGSDGLINFLEKGDIIIDGGNSFYKDALERYQRLKVKRLRFIDVGVSGGPEGALKGASLMIGGDKEIFEKLEPLFYDLATEKGYQFFAGAGSGHFVKMVHNGIEYGMMQAIAEGFTILQKADYKLDLTKVANVYNHGSVIESRLIGWLEKAFELHGQNLENISGTVGYTGEGGWTVQTAKELNVKDKVIEEALVFRIQSEKNPNYTGKILSALREQFGRHEVIK